MINLSHAKGLVVLGKTFLLAHRPELLFGASVVSTVSAAVLGAKGGYEARGLVDEEIRRRDAANEQEPALTTREKANLTWHCYWPAAAATLAGVGSTTGLHIVHIKEKKQLAAMALLAIDEIKKEAAEAVEEHVGPLSKDQQEKVLEKTANKKTGVAKVENSDGEVDELFLVRDMESGRDIWSNKLRIEEAMCEVANMVNGSGNASLNNFYEQAGFGRLDRADYVGWSGVLPSIDWNDPNGVPIAGVRDDGRPWRGFRFRPGVEDGYDDPKR